MAYIGTRPTVGNFVKLDTITATATTTFNLLNGGVAYYPQSPNHCLVSLNGILQAPTDSFTISGSTIIFSSALTTSDVIDFIIVLGDVLNIGTPSDSTVSLAKLTATGTPSSSTFLRGDNSWASAGATAGQVIQVVGATDSTERSSPNTGYGTASNTLAVTITPASTSNKILVMYSTTLYSDGDNKTVWTTLYRGATNLASNGLTRWERASSAPAQVSALFLDSPSSTSALTYQVYMKVASFTGTLNYTGTTGQIVAMEIKG